MNPRDFTPVKIHKHLLTAEEKESILAAMRSQKQPVKYWAAVFKRLPATIRKLAAEAQIELRD